MVCFPLDNTVYQADALGAWCAGRTRGIFSGDDHFRVTTNGNMSINLSPGIAWLKADAYWGVCLYEKNDTTLQLGTADGTMHKCVAVCLQLDKNKNKASAIIKHGEFDASKAGALKKLPAPVQNNPDFDEIYVATVHIAPSVISIARGDITDQRLNETYCGVARDGVTRLPTQQLYDAWYGWFERQKNESELVFNNWFTNLQDLLNENDIIMLQNKLMGSIDARRKRLALGPANWETPLITNALAFGADGVSNIYVNSNNASESAWVQEI